jgi:hypothetical protein
MLKWEIYVKKRNGELRLIKTMSEEDGYSYESALVYSQACAENVEGVTNVWIFCARVADNKVVCKDHYYAGA